MAKRLRAAVIGGGIGGLSTALALHRIGAHVRVYERAHRLGDVGAGVSLQRNSQRVLDRLGVGARVRRFGSLLPEFEFFTPDGTLVSHEMYSVGAWPLALRRADLVAALASSLPPGTVCTGHRCVLFGQDEDSAVVGFDNGALVRADVVIGADGIHSTLQRHVLEAGDPVFSGMVAYRGLIPSGRLPTWPRGLVTWGGDGRHLLTYPVRAGRFVNYVGFVPADEGMVETWSAPGDPAALVAAFAGWAPPTRHLLSRVESTFRWGLYDRDPLPRWTTGRLALLGDAAHPMLPHLGQGANQAIEDALALAILLRGVPAADVPDALTRYETLRRGHTARVQHDARINGHLFDSAQPVSLNHSWVQDYDVEKEARAIA
ncbi:FAD-dependent monooxygenase [Mycobacterium sp. ACS4331]|uniref:FAD-dependent monooxygenase n=1 Tax=Mycobacterium sp. ACS4331 TaxID=1834121 RepID=UPI0007FCCABF|nr:FAD-dependent monooxygenase [Mycobacterium sp. ACS4331]OBF20637.1 hypothetical protein A5727_09025 [Mycobacterium sp. ACS4331]